MPDAADQRFAPPQAHGADLESDEIVLAGRGSRLMAAIVDALISAAIVWAVLRMPTLGPMFQAETQAAVDNVWWSFRPLSMALGAGCW